MGYYISLQKSNWVIPTENLDDAYKAMCDLNKDDSLKHGRSSKGEKWFAWVPADYPSECKDAESILTMLGFELESNEKGLRIISYDNKIGDEKYFVQALAPFVEVGSFLEWTGEENDMWREEVTLVWDQDDNAVHELVTKTPVITWV
jgi:hypothetical protein